MKSYRKKPIVIQATQVTREWFDGPHPNPLHLPPDPNVQYDPVGRKIRIRTLEGVMVADEGDWIIRGVKGELYPCKPDIFAATYEAVTP